MASKLGKIKINQVTVVLSEPRRHRGRFSSPLTLLARTYQEITPEDKRGPLIAALPSLGAPVRPCCPCAGWWDRGRPRPPRLS